MKQDIKNLEKVCEPVVEYLKENYDPHSTVIITDNQIHLVRDEIGVSIKEIELPTPGVTQEQLSEIKKTAKVLQFCITIQSVSFLILLIKLLLIFN